MDQLLISGNVQHPYPPLNRNGLKKYYEVPEANFPAIPVLLQLQKSSADTPPEPDEYAWQRTRDNVDEY